MRKLSVMFFIGSALSLFKGFHKMLVYKNYDAEKYPTLALDNINSYVGGDAYNITINGTHAIAYFVLFGSLLIAGLLVEMISMYKKESKVDKVAITTKDEESPLNNPQ